VLRARYTFTQERKRRKEPLISSNPFDVVGASAAGMRAARVDRSGGLFDTLGPRPDLVVSSLTELADALAWHSRQAACISFQRLDVSIVHRHVVYNRYGKGRYTGNE